MKKWLGNYNLRYENFGTCNALHTWEAKKIPIIPQVYAPHYIYIYIYEYKGLLTKF